MKVGLILGGIALLCGAFYFVMTDSRVKQALKSTPLIDFVSTSQSVKPQHHIKVSKSQPLINDNTGSFLALAKGTQLISALEHFWKQCKQANNCDEALTLEQAKLTNNRFEILLLYPNNTFLREQLLGNSLLSQGVDLIDKIKHVKMIEQQIWGDETNTLFVDTYAQYDFNEEARMLVEDVIDAEMFITALRFLLSQIIYSHQINNK